MSHIGHPLYIILSVIEADGRADGMREDGRSTDRPRPPSKSKRRSKFRAAPLPLLTSNTVLLAAAIFRFRVSRVSIRGRVDRGRRICRLLDRGSCVSCYCITMSRRQNGGAQSSRSVVLHSVWVIWDSLYGTLDKNKHGTWDSVYWVMKKLVSVRGQSR